MNKGFTLIELLAVLVILAIILTIVVISVNSVLSSSEKSLSDIQKNRIEEAARVYYLKEGKSDEDCISVQSLINKGYIEGSEVIDPETDEPITGSVKITYASNQYSYTYQDKACQLCELVEGTSKTVGAKYTCTVMDDVYFYVLENNPSSENISLIMDRNYTDDEVPKTMAWCDPNGDNPNNNACNHDNLDPLVAHIQTQFGSNVTVTLPTKAQIKGGSMPTWLYDYLDSTTHSVSGVDGYWTASPVGATSADGAWTVYYGGRVLSYYVNTDDYFGIRPVITISKNAID